MMSPSRWCFTLLAVHGRFEGVPGDGACPRDLARYLLGGNFLRLRAEVGSQALFPAFVPRASVPMVRGSSPVVRGGTRVIRPCPS